MIQNKIAIIEKIVKGEIKKIIEGRKLDKSSVGLFIRVPDNISKKFPDDRLEKDNSPVHVTFLHIGNKYSEDDRDKIIGIIHRVVSEIPSCKAILNGVDYFRKENTAIPYVKIKFEPDIRAWKNKVWQALEKEGFEIEDGFFDYVPHSTLAYEEGVKENEDYEWKRPVPTGEFEVKEIELWGWDKDYKFQLKTQKEI